MNKRKYIPAIAKHLYLLLGCLLILFPLYFVIVSAIKPDDEIFLYPFSLPKVWKLSNITDVLFKDQFYRYIFNSFKIALFSCTLSALTSVSASYALIRMRWKWSRKVNALLMIGIMIPMHAVILPLYLTVRKSGLSNPHLILVLLFAAFALPRSIFIISGFLKDIPVALEESAAIDGASMYTILARIITPLLSPAIATVCIFNFLSVWNDLLISMIFVSETKDLTIQLGIMRYMGENTTLYGLVMAAVLISAIPTIAIFLLFQKKIIAGISAGAVKG